MTDPKSPPAGGAPGAAPTGASALLANASRPPTDGPTVDVGTPAPKEERTRVLKQAKREKKVKARQAMQAKLVVKRPDVPAADLLLTRPRTIIGRDRDRSDLVLEDDSVSRQHASISREESGYFVLHDLGSRNGVVVGGRRTERRTLVNGDSFTVGDTRFTFVELRPDGSAVEPVKVLPPEKPAPPPTPPAAAAPPSPAAAPSTGAPAPAGAAGAPPSNAPNWPPPPDAPKAG